jgi:hypothetical protein
VILNLKIEFPNFKACLAWRFLNLWNPKLIYIKPEHFSTCRVDIYKFFFSILNNNMTLFLWFWFKQQNSRTLKHVVAWRCLNLWNPMLINIKPKQFSTWQFHIYYSIFLLTLKITRHCSCEYEYKLDSESELQRMFGIRVQILWNWFVIVIKPEHFSKCRVDIYKFFF